MPPSGSIAAEVRELHDSLLISIKSGPRIPHPYHLSSDGRSQNTVPIASTQVVIKGTVQYSMGAVFSSIQQTSVSRAVSD